MIYCLNEMQYVFVWWIFSVLCYLLPILCNMLIMEFIIILMSDEKFKWNGFMSRNSIMSLYIQSLGIFSTGQFQAKRSTIL